METITSVDAAVDMDAAPVGVADMDDHQLCPLQSTAGLTETEHMIAKNAHTLLRDTRRIRPLRTLWAAAPTGATTSPNDREVQ